MSVPGLNAVHRWDDVVSLNHKITFPHVKLLRLPGFHAMPERELTTDIPVGRLGELPRQAFTRGKALVYEGTAKATSQAMLEAWRADLLEAFARSDEGQMVITPYSEDLNPAPTHRFRARVTALDIPEELPADVQRVSYGFERNFVLGLRMHDPRFYSFAVIEARSADIAPQSGTPLPWSLPVAIASSGTSAGTFQAINEGTAPTPFEVELWGPSSGPRFVNQTIGREIAFKESFSIQQGQFVRINYATGEMLLNGIEDVSGARDRARTSWWDMDSPDGLVKGVNNLQYAGTNMTDPAEAVLRFSHAYWG